MSQDLLIITLERLQVDLILIIEMISHLGVPNDIRPGCETMRNIALLGDEVVETWKLVSSMDQLSLVIIAVAVGIVCLETSEIADLYIFR